MTEKYKGKHGLLRIAKTCPGPEKTQPRQAKSIIGRCASYAISMYTVHRAI